MADRDTSRRGGPKQVRIMQRRVHLLTGLVVVAYIYGRPAPGSTVAVGVRWLVLPFLVASGLAMWQWPRIRRLARQRKVDA